MTIQKYENEINTILEEIKEMEARTDDVDDFSETCGDACRSHIL